MQMTSRGEDADEETESVNTQPVDQDDSDMPELYIFKQPQRGYFLMRLLMMTRQNVQKHSVCTCTCKLGSKVAKEHSQRSIAIVCLPASYVRRETKKISEALKMKVGLKAMQRSYSSLACNRYVILVDLPHGSKVIGTIMGIQKNKRDEKGSSCQKLRPETSAQRSQQRSMDMKGYDDKTLFIKKVEEGYHVGSSGIHNRCVVQFLRSRLISWQCKKQTIVATFTTEAEYVAADGAMTDVVEKKPEESAGFVEIVDLLKGSHIRYALTHNPTIHDSLVKQFWQTAIASTLADGTLELRSIIDTLEYTITEASVRSKLQLADASRISMLPNTKIFEGMGNIGIYNFSKLIFNGMVANLKSKTKFLMYPRFLQMILEIQTEDKHPYLAIVLTKKIFGNMKRGFRGVPRPLLPVMLPVVAVDQSAGPADQASDQPSSSALLPSSSHPPVISATLASESTPVAEPTTHHTLPSPGPDNEPTRNIFEQPSPEHQPLSPRQETKIPQSQDLTHPHGPEARTMIVEDLLHLVPNLITKVDSLETELKQTKLTMGKAIVNNDLRLSKGSIWPNYLMNQEKESRKRTGCRGQMNLLEAKFDTRGGCFCSKEKDKRKGLQKKPESTKSVTKEDVEAYMEERVDEPSSEEFPMSLIPQGPAPAKIVKWQIIRRKRGAYQVIREINSCGICETFKAY
ncbi:hypothetical protein Tco_1237051 [Tanacetum coccineum]